MKVLVTVKSCSYLSDDFDVDGNDIDEMYFDYDLNESDEYAIEEAVQLADARDDVEVVSVTIGPFHATDTIRLALAKGVDRAIRVWDDALADRTVLTPGLKAEILEAVVEAERPDLVFTGVQTDDDAFGATGVSLASTVGYSWAAVITRFDLNDDGETAEIHRELEGGVTEIRELELPAVATVQAGINEPTYVSLRNLYGQDRDGDMERRTLDDLGVDPEAFEDVRRTAITRPERTATYIEGDPPEAAARLTELLHEEGVVE